ncbi:hypothetical protein JZ751_016390 [Albula glossodonta]|uniref:Uncharacterized protein n=1 Tax=Albula glossodonta TaxID=121402 RepID=A0A8T2NT92_9TELE|nr:hypothetical protein JZ751_016390 [Albula glossodonta]
MSVHCGSFEAEIASIMEVLSKTAVAEIMKLVYNGSADLCVPVCKYKRENETLRRKLQLMENELISTREYMGGPQETSASISFEFHGCNEITESEIMNENSLTTQKVFDERCENAHGITRDGHSHSMKTEDSQLQPMGPAGGFSYSQLCHAGGAVQQGGGLGLVCKEEPECEPPSQSSSPAGPAMGLQLQCVWSEATDSRPVQKNQGPHGQSTEHGDDAAGDDSDTDMSDMDSSVGSDPESAPDHDGSAFRKAPSGQTASYSQGLFRQSLLYMTDYEEGEDDGEEEEDSSSSLTVKACRRNDEGKRVWDKRHFCFYCEKPNSKIARHLERKHLHEPDVAHALSYPKGSKRRAVLLEKLRNKGDYYHNVEVLKNGGGELVTWRQPAAGADPNDYLPCQLCLGFFIKSELWKHEATCRLKTESLKSKARKRVQAASSRLVPVPSSATQGCQEIIHNLHQDEVAFHIKNDSLIQKFGDSLYAKHGHKTSQHVHIGQKMRELGRFMLAVKLLDQSVHSLREVCVPYRFELAVSAAHNASGFRPDLNRYKRPSFALKLGYSLKRASEIAIGESLMNGDKTGEKNAKDFIKLLDADWEKKVSSHARNTPQETNSDEADMIPLTENVRTLQDYIKDLEDSLAAATDQGHNSDDDDAISETELFYEGGPNGTIERASTSNNLGGPDATVDQGNNSGDDHDGIHDGDDGGSLETSRISSSKPEAAVEQR